MTPRRALLGVYWGLRGVITPTLRFSQFLYAEVLARHVHPDTQWLDLGCGHQILPIWQAEEEQLLAARCKSIVGLDFDFDSLKSHATISRRVSGDITRLPFQDQSFDLVTANMVVEHLDNPEAQFPEVSRVLKPGGIFLLHTPNAFGYSTALARLVRRGPKLKLVRVLEGREAADVYPAHYRANTKNRITELGRAAGLDVVKVKMLVTDAVFAVVPPLAAIELVWIKILMTRPFKPLRTNLIAIMKKGERVDARS